MGKSYSKDLRERIYAEVELTGSRRAAARHFRVSASTGVRLAQRMAVTGSLAPARQGRPVGSGKLAAHAEFLIGVVSAQGDITMPELAAKLLEEQGITVHPASLSRFLIAQGLSFKKNTARQRDRAGRCRLRAPGLA